MYAAATLSESGFKLKLRFNHVRRLEAAMAQTARSKEEVNSLTMQLEARVAEHSEEISRRCDADCGYAA